jgi:hypothetical protein
LLERRSVCISYQNTSIFLLTLLNLKNA